jgi:ribonuclease HII
MATKTSGPDWSFETEAFTNGQRPVAGVDEAGRGPWAGPVVAAAVILDPESIPAGLDDSKKLSAERRDGLWDEINARAQAVSVGISDVDRIDRDNILNATLWAMCEAVKGLGVAPGMVLVDGNRPPPLTCPLQTVVKGDQRSLSIAAASIIAKVARDRIMARLAADHPHYGWERNKGYGTAEHSTALQRHGPCAHHRRSFKPIAELLAEP